MALQERDFYVETPGTRPATYTCPHCKRRNEFQLRWVTRIKKDRLPPAADDRDRAQFPKLRHYMIRTDDLVTCPTCRRRFEVPSHQSLVFLADGQAPIQYDPINRAAAGSSSVSGVRTAPPSARYTASASFWDCARPSTPRPWSPASATCWWASRA